MRVNTIFSDYLSILGKCLLIVKGRRRLIKLRNLHCDFYSLFGSNFAHLPHRDSGKPRGFREGGCPCRWDRQKQATTCLGVKKQHALNLTYRGVKSDMRFKVKPVIKSATREYAHLSIFSRTMNERECMPIKSYSTARSFSHFGSMPQ